MRLDGALVDGEGGELVGEALIEKSGSTKSSSKKNRRRQKQQRQRPVMPTAVQRLFETCKEVFSNAGTGFVPSPEDVERIQSVLDTMKPSDVNLSPNVPCFRKVRTATGAIPITYLELHECRNFSIGIFCLPPSGVIPLHNHPGMTVFSKLLFGSLHIKSYDWADAPLVSSDSTHVPVPGVQLAKLMTDNVFTAPCNTTTLYPASGGNVHCLTAKTSCAVLDVLGPPYSDDDGRHCTYYNEIPYSRFSGDGNKAPMDGEYAWLEEREIPENCCVLRAEYMGPKIIDG